MSKILIIGAGHLGTAFGKMLELAGQDVELVDVRPIPNSGLPFTQINPDGVIDVRSHDTILITVPTQSLPSVVNQLNYVGEKHTIVLTQKSVVVNKTPIELIDHLPGAHLYLYCAGFAKNLLDQVSMMALGYRKEDENKAIEFAAMFDKLPIRIYGTHQPRTLCLAAAFRHLLSFQAGIAHERFKDEENTRASLLSGVLREYWEMLANTSRNQEIKLSRIAQVIEADIHLCFDKDSPSRNLRAGLKVAEGMEFSDACQKVEGESGVVECYHGILEIYSMLQVMLGDRMSTDSIREYLYKFYPFFIATVEIAEGKKIDPIIDGLIDRQRLAGFVPAIS